MTIVPDPYKKCVTFLFVEEANKDSQEAKLTPLGTAFFVSKYLDNNTTVVYVVTARHVIYAAGNAHSVLVQFRRTDGTSKPESSSIQSCFTAEGHVDVAAMPISLPLDCDCECIPLDQFVTDEKLDQTGIGDEVFFPGLFSEYTGDAQNIPIFRFGNLSLFPEETVNVQLYPDDENRYPIDAYLVEAKSWGGYSGSPVFLYEGLMSGRSVREIRQTMQGHKLLGMVQGHIPVREKVRFRGDIIDPDDPRVNVNSGIAIVVPAKTIREVLMDKRLADVREIRGS